MSWYSTFYGSTVVEMKESPRQTSYLPDHTHSREIFDISGHVYTKNFSSGYILILNYKPPFPEPSSRTRTTWTLYPHYFGWSTRAILLIYFVLVTLVVVL